jgi:hypothetical protein
VKSTGGILIVDDDPDLREFLRLMLTSMGFKVTSAANGREALDVMEGHDPDLILLDMKMPVMVGSSAALSRAATLARRSSCSPPPPIRHAGPQRRTPTGGSASRSNTKIWRRPCAGSLLDESCTDGACRGNV